MNNKGIFRWSNLYILIMFLLVTVIIVAPDFLFLQVFSDYYNHFIALFFLLGLVGFVMNHRNMILTSFSFCALLCVLIKQESSSPFVHSSQQNEASSLKVGHINLSNADNPFELISLLNELDLDYISFVEFTPFWKKVLEESIRSNYKFRVCMERIDLYGKAIYSKYPITITDTIYANGVMDLVVTTNIETKKYHLVSTFVVPALDEISNTIAINQLNKLADVVNKYPNTKIVLGEYNMVYWSKPIKDFKLYTGLISNRREIVPASFDIPRDNIFNSGDLSCIKIKDIKTQAGLRLGLYAHYLINDKNPELHPELQRKSN